MRFTLKFRALVTSFLFCFLVDSSVFGDDKPRYNAEAGSDEAGQLLEEPCNYPVKIFSTKLHLCQESLRLIAESNGLEFDRTDRQTELQAISCADKNNFKSVSHTFFVDQAGQKTLTKTLVKITGDLECETELKRVFAHYEVTAEGRIEFVPSHLKAIRTTCK
jgi:hypothetical protein